MQHPTNVGAENMLGIAEKFLEIHDLHSSRKYAIFAQQIDPLLEGPNRIIAITNVLFAAEEEVQNHHDWYAILGVDHGSDNIEAIKRQYHRLALLLHPDKSSFPFTKEAFNLIVEAWNVLSDSVKKSEFDKISFPRRGRLKKLPIHRPVSIIQRNPTQLHSNVSEKVTMMEENLRRKNETFWTPCPYCYYLYEYPRVYEDCSLQCQNCKRSFHGVELASLPPLVPGKDAYYFNWGFSPMSFNSKSNGSKKKEKEKEVVPPQHKQSWQP